MALNISSFRINAATAARSAVVAGLVLGGLASTAKAEKVDSNAYPGTSVCAPFSGTERGIRCEIEQSKLRTQQYNRDAAAAVERGKAADAAGAKSDKENAITLTLQACMNYIKAGTGTKFTKDEVLAAADGKLNRENVCGVARKFGYDKSASLDLK